MLAEMIRGLVCTGIGRVHKLPEAVLQDRRAVTGMDLVPGTLNVRVDDLDAAIRALGAPTASLPGPERLGPLRFWPVTVMVEYLTVPGFVVRHVHSVAPYLELVSDVQFREQGIRDGASVTISGTSEVASA